MNKADLIEQMATDAGITKTAAGAALDSLLAHVTQSLERGQKVTLMGFGTFDITRRRARAGRNPRTGEPIRIAARRVPRFTAGKGLRKAVG